MGDIYHKRKEIFFANVLLLGFDVHHAEEKYGFAFNKDTFDVPNQKAFEVITHFLFSKLNEVSRDEYRLLWPVLDKAQEREFMKTCKAYLTKISRSSEHVRFPNVGQVLMNPGGTHRFYELYMAFSSYVMQQIIARDKVCEQLCRPTITPDNQCEIKETLQLSTIISTKEYAESQERTSECQEIWSETAQNFVSYYRKTKRQIVDIQRHLKEVSQSLVPACSSEESKMISEEERLQKASLRSDQLFQEVSSSWNELEKTAMKEGLLWDIIKSALENECVEKPILDGQKYISQIPDFLKMNYKKELLEEGVQSLIEDGKFSIKRFLCLHHINLAHYEKLLKEVSATDLDGFSEELQNYIEKLKSILHHAESVRNSVEQNFLPDVSEEKDKLEHELYATVPDDKIENISRELPPSLPPFSISDELLYAGDPEYYFQLAPELDLELRDSKLQYSQAFPSSTDASQTLFPSNVMDINERLSQLGPSVAEESKCMETSSSEKKHQNLTQWLSVNHPESAHQKNNFDPESEDMLVNFSLNESQPNTLFQFNNRYRTFSDDNSFSTSVNEQSDLNMVQKKFVEHLVDKYKKDSDATLSSEESSPFSCSRGSDFMGETAFDRNDNLFRTPPLSAENALVSQHSIAAELNPQESFGVDQTVGSPRSYRRLSCPDDELLDNMTLPDVPYL